MNLDTIPTPCYVVDLARLRRNLQILANVQDRTGAKILLALKGFAMFSLFPLIGKTLKGTCASSPHEARLGREEMGGEVHAYAPAYSAADIQALSTTADHVVFNSFAQWRRFRPLIAAAARKIHCGLRVNPEFSTAAVELYDPCARFSRLGIRHEQFIGEDLTGISGLHFHTLCEQNSPALADTLQEFEKNFGDRLPGMQWLNFGGGHHITRPDYDVELLCELISHFQNRYGLQVYLEPGEAVALNAGILVATVLDIVNNGMDIAILDTSATAHMPDVLEMPYRPALRNAGGPGQLPHTYRLAGVSCLAGDVIGDYSFTEPLTVGTKLIFEDMAHYTMVKNTTFNGVQLPAIAIYEPDGDRLRLVKTFGYEDYKNRLS